MRFFSKLRKRVLDDADFGPIKEGKRGQWEGQHFQLWGYSSVQVLIDAGPDGPSMEHRSFVRSLQLEHAGIRSRIEEAVSLHARQTSQQPGPLKMSSIYLPQKPSEQTWRVWYDLVGEEHFWYGAEISGWQEIAPFTED